MNTGFHIFKPTMTNIQCVKFGATRKGFFHVPNFEDVTKRKGVFYAKGCTF
ncbi:MAG: hypothetical protein JSV97_01765 [candidate division WOR-3 bacterium]|nr:MAG: hypothetical protein JSV97_01765 [candidate division WOR-3 bacterium]